MVRIPCLLHVGISMAPEEAWHNGCHPTIVPSDCGGQSQGRCLPPGTLPDSTHSKSLGSPRRTLTLP